jgi:hypothetical protein
MSIPRVGVAIATLLSSFACTTIAAEQPAVLIDPSEADRAELVRVLRGALNGAPLVLADDALTRESLLTVEAQPRGALDSPPLTGRVLTMPEQFRLVLDGDRCVLVRRSDGARFPLGMARCAPTPSVGDH